MPEAATGRPEEPETVARRLFNAGIVLLWIRLAFQKTRTPGKAAAFYLPLFLAS